MNYNHPGYNHPGIEIFLQPKEPSHNYVINYYNFKVTDFINALHVIPVEDWLELGRNKWLNLFHLAAAQVPAYKKFLYEHGIDHEKIITWQDFIQVPVIDKDNYLKKYPLEDLCWPGQFNKQHMISASSGSSGSPFLWPRSSWQEFEASLTHELLFYKFWQIDKKSTLLIVNFYMGMYVAGVLTQNCGLRLAQKNYPLTVISPGISVNECVRIIEELGNKYDQVILAGYPPFLKDVIDAAGQAGVDWSRMNLKFLFAGEGFSEDWRSHILRQVRADDKYTGSFSLYGSADANILAHETPATISLRRMANDDSSLANVLFGNSKRLPGLFQWNPLSRYFETVQGEIVFSADSGIPLLRYNIHDNGQVINNSELVSRLRANNLSSDIIDKVEEWPWPFLALQGKNQAVIYYGLLIYPENIRAGLDSDKINAYISGRAAVAKKYDENKNSYLEVNIELAPGVEYSRQLEEIITKELITALINTNLEYNRLRETMGNKVNPRVKLLPYGDPRYFNRQGKQSWIIGAS